MFEKVYKFSSHTLQVNLFKFQSISAFYNVWESLKFTS